MNLRLLLASIPSKTILIFWNLQRAFPVMTLLLVFFLYGCDTKTNNSNQFDPEAPKRYFHEKWKSLYTGNSVVYDSARKWLDSSLLINSWSTIRNNELVQLSLLDLRDPFFYQQTDSLLAQRIISNLTFENEPSFITGKKMMDSLISDYQKNCSTFKTPLIEDQIWDEDFRFTINRCHPEAYSLKADVPEKYLRSIKQFGMGGQIQIGFLDSIRSMISSIEKVRDEDTRVSLLFKLLVRVGDLRLQEQIWSPTNEIVKSIVAQCHASTNITNKDKAGWILACAKFISNEYMTFSQMYSYLKLAEGYAELEPKDSLWLKKIKVIQFKLLLNPEREWQKDMLLDVYYEVKGGHHAIEPKRFESPKEEYAKNVLRTIQFELAQLSTDIQKRGVKGYREFLDIASCLNVLDAYYTDTQFPTDDNIRYDYLMALSEYHRLMLDLEKALACSYKALEIQSNSMNPLLKTRLPETAFKIELLFKDKGDPSDSVISSNGIQYTKFFPFQIPRDSRLWKEHHYDTLVNQLRNYLQGPNADYQLFVDFPRYTNHSVTDVLKKIGMHELELNRSSEAHHFLSRLDFVETFDSYQMAELYRDGTLNHKIAKEFYMDKELDRSRRERNIVVTALIIIGLIGFYAILQRIKAQREARLSEYRAKVWQEFAHTTRGVLMGISSKLPHHDFQMESIIPVFANLTSLVNEIFASLIEANKTMGREIKKEIFLTELFVRHKNLLNGTDIQFVAPKTPPDFELPPALLVSLVKNSMEGGRLISSGSGTVWLRFETKNHRHVEILIEDNGCGFPNHIKRVEDITNPESTGLRNASAVISYFNYRKRVVTFWMKLEKLTKPATEKLSSVWSSIEKMSGIWDSVWDRRPTFFKKRDAIQLHDPMQISQLTTVRFKIKT